MPIEPLVVAPREAELARLGEARLPDAHRVLRVPARRERQIRQHRAERRRESLVESSVELRAAMCVRAAPRSARRTRARDARRSGSSLPRTSCRRRAARSRDARAGRTFQSTARSTSVSSPSRTPAAASAALFHTWRLDMPSSYDAMSAALGATSRSRNAFSELADLRCRRARLEQIEREHELQQPDRLQIRAEERTRGAEHVVAIRVAEILIGVRVEQRGRRAHALAGRPAARRAKPRAIRARRARAGASRVGIGRVPRPRTRARRRGRGAACQRIEDEQRAVVLATSTSAREMRLQRGTSGGCATSGSSSARKPPASGASAPVATRRRARRSSAETRSSSGAKWRERSSREP